MESRPVVNKCKPFLRDFLMEKAIEKSMITKECGVQGNPFFILRWDLVEYVCMLLEMSQ